MRAGMRTCVGALRWNTVVDTEEKVPNCLLLLVFFNDRIRAFVLVFKVLHNSFTETTLCYSIKKFDWTRWFNRKNKQNTACSS